MDYERNQNLGGETPNWDVSPDRDPRTLGNRIISTPDTSTNSQEPRLGEIIPADPIPGPLPPTFSDAPKTAPVAAFDHQAVREEKGSGRISTHTLTEINKLEQKLNQDGDLSSFYDNARDMTSAYLENSFDRKLGESK
ncbi:MAG: hypothetical protein Q4B34_02175 [Candidatus Saccharibacteria bacterium]|nr:hypothetical protein [Candidatus Saccharibacteria bacterium]